MKIENFFTKLNEEQTFLIQIVHMDNSAYIYIGDENQKMNNGLIGIQTKYEKIPTVFKFLEEDDIKIDEDQVEKLAKVLTKRSKKVLTISINVEINEPDTYNSLQEFLLSKLCQ